MAVRQLPTRATWIALFGVVPDRGLHRRPTDVLRAIVGIIVFSIGALAALSYSKLDRAVHSVVTTLPDPVLSVFTWMNGAGLVAAAIVVWIVALSSRRPRFIGSLAVTSVAAWSLAWLAQKVINAPASVDAAAKGLTDYPQYPSIRLAFVAAVFFVASPEITRPSRRALMTILIVVAVSATARSEGYPAGIFGSIALAYVIAAIVHLVFGSPDGMPDPKEIENDLNADGYNVTDLEIAKVQTWGEKAFVGRLDSSPSRIVVIGRDALDGQLLSKLGRFLWFKDSGSTIAITHRQQIEHHAYVLLLAERHGVRAPRVVTSGDLGARRDAVLVTTISEGTSLDTLSAEEFAQVDLDDIWSQLKLLHDAGIAHGSLWSGAIRTTQDGCEFTDLSTANTNADDEGFEIDRVALLVTLAEKIGVENAVASADKALGKDGLVALLPYVQVTALSRSNRKSVDGLRKLCSDCRDLISKQTGVEAPKLVELRRVAPSSFLIAGFTILGVYLLIGQFSDVNWSAMFTDANWWWVPWVIVFAQVPILGLSFSLLGSVSRPLPLRPVIMLEIGTKFTGLAGGGVTTMALIVRFFQKQGMAPGVAVTSSLLNSVASGITQVLFLVVSFILGAHAFSFGSKASGGGIGGKILIVAAIVSAVCAFAFLLPSLRKRLGGFLAPQIRSARHNLKAVLSNPRKGLQMLGGNALSQVFYAMVLWAALHVYGHSLGLAELIVINSLASILGGIAPVPGGIGVIEAGLIGGFTAAGIPEQAAIAATFTARLFTAYLPPIWGWLSINWMRRREYV